MSFETLALILTGLILWGLIVKLTYDRSQLRSKLEFLQDTTNLERVSLQAQLTELIESRDFFANEVKLSAKALVEVKEAWNAEVVKIEAEWKRKFEDWRDLEEKKIRKDALVRSKRVVKGLSAEHFAPHMVTEYDARDFRFIGDPIDYLVCVGASKVRSGEADELEKVVLLDVKTGKSQLNKVQRRIKDAIKDGRVEFEIFRPGLKD